MLKPHNAENVEDLREHSSILRGHREKY